MRFFTVFLTLFSLISMQAISQSLTEQADEILVTHHGSFSPVGLVVSVSKPGELLYENALGFSDLAFDVETKTDHSFRIGSLTKQFTAVAILKLVEEQKLSLKDSVQKFLPDFPAKGHTITVEHLLTHTSGIMDYGMKEDWFPLISKTAKSPLEMVDYFKNDTLMFEPGTQYSYSNSGYHILGCIIEKVSGQKYDEYLASIIFKPLHMNRTLAHSSADVLKDFANGYEKLNDEIIEPPFVHPSQPYAAGNIVSTTADMRKWYEGVFAGKIISEETLALALKPYQLADGTFTQYGFGWEIDSLQGMPVIRHGGNYPGYISEALYFLDSEILVTALSNSMPLSNMVNKIGAEANGTPLEEPKFISLKNDVLKTYAAEYGNEMERWKFEVRNERFYYSINGMHRYEIKPVEKNLFYSLDWDVYFEFRKNKVSEAHTFVLHWNGQEIPYEKL